MGRALFVVMWQVRQNQDEPRSRSSREEVPAAVSSAQQEMVVQSWHKQQYKKKQQKHKNAESLLAQ